MGVSIKDIAKAAGVSHSTVSRALADSPLVAEETKRRVRRLAKEMGYSPSAIARGLVTKHTHTVGLVVTTIADPFVSEEGRRTTDLLKPRGHAQDLRHSITPRHAPCQSIIVRRIEDAHRIRELIFEEFPPEEEPRDLEIFHGDGHEI